MLFTGNPTIIFIQQQRKYSKKIDWRESKDTLSKLFIASPEEKTDSENSNSNTVDSCRIIQKSQVETGKGTKW